MLHDGNFRVTETANYWHPVILNQVGRELRMHLVTDYLMYYLGVCLLGEGRQPSQKKCASSMS